jgi:hypothetical protein
MSAPPIVVGEMTLRALARRRASLVLLVSLPLAFYLARHAQPWQAVRFLGVGLAWATSTVALFAALAARETEPRLRTGGWSRRDLLAGRVAAIALLALLLAAGYVALVAVDEPIGTTGSLALALVVTALTGVATGSALGALAPRELEGALLLFIVAGMQTVVDPEGTAARLLPFWSTRELMTRAVEGSASTASVGAALAHAAATVVICGLVVTTATWRRHRRG